MDSPQNGDKPIIDETLYYLKPGEQVNLTNCDREPIHIISHVQPHGALLALNPADLTITQASENTQTYLGVAAADLLGQGAERLFGAEQIEELRKNVAEGRLDANSLYLFSAPVAGRERFHVTAHVYREVLLVELEPVLPEDASPDYYSLIKKTLARFEGTKSMREFAQVVCEEVRRISGFDRVMVYKFAEDYSGHVIAEDLAPEQNKRESFLDLHYPASDIPKQARALFVLNMIRLMPDARYVPSPLIPARNPLTDRPLDMSYTFLRGVSQMYTEYLINRGACASLTLAIVKGGELWGLVACHHYSPRRVAYDVRTAGEFLGRVISLQIVEKEASDEADYRRRIDEMNYCLARNMAQQSTLMPALADGEPNVMGFLDCGGCALLLEGEYRLFGKTPDEAQVRALAEWLSIEHPEEVYATSKLPAEYPKAQTFKAVASGMLACRITRQPTGYLLWFRPEVIQTVNWGGDPAKPYETGPMGDRLTPRKSFALWEETVRETSLEWKAVEIDAVRRLRVTVLEVMARLAEYLALANEHLAKSNIELDAFAYIASHDLKEPLRGIYNFSYFLQEDYGGLLPEEGREQLETVLKLTKRMEALIDSLLHYSRVGSIEFTFEETDLDKQVHDVLESLHLRIEETRAVVRIPRPLPKVRCARVQIGEVFHNLINNALKYNDKAEKWVEIGWEQRADGAMTTFFVRDNGIGINSDQIEDIFRIFKRLHGRTEFGGGTGAGLTIARKIVERHRGSLWAESTPGEGTTFYFTLPEGQK